MKMVISGYAGAGTIDDGRLRLPRPGPLHRRGTRLPRRTLHGRLPRVRGARGVPLMLYVFSDGSLSADGQVDNTVDGRGKFMWTSDNQSTAASFFLVYNPAGRAVLLEYRARRRGAPPADRLLPAGRVGRDGLEPGGEQRQPARRDRRAQLHGAARRAGQFGTRFPAEPRPRVRGAAGQPDRLQPIVSGTIELAVLVADAPARRTHAIGPSSAAWRVITCAAGTAT